MHFKQATLFIMILFIFASSCVQTQSQSSGDFAPGLRATDNYTLAGTDFLLDYEPFNADSTINVVVEIPAGTTAKWEVTKPDGLLKWEFKEGRPRIVKYLGYPGNYGMIPGTLLSKELGGDGDPLDVIVLGSAVLRGSVVKANPIGVLRLLDEGEQDDKILAVMADTPFYDVRDLQELRQKFPGVTEIIEIWFVNYKGQGKLVSEGFGDEREAKRIVEKAVMEFVSTKSD